MGDKKMNFLQLIDIDWFKFLIPALGFMAFGFAETKEKEKEEEEEEEKEDEEEEEEEKEDDKLQQTFPRSHVVDLRTENKKNRIKLKEALEKLKKIEDDKLKADGEHEKRADKIESEAKEEKTKLTKRIKISELKAEAKSQGIIDTDLVKLIDLEDVDMDDDFNTTNVKEVMEEFKKKHPKLFDDNEDEDDEERDPEDNKKPGRKDKSNQGDIDKMSGAEALRAHFSGEGKKRKKRK